jgi:hypothetical protein
MSEQKECQTCGETWTEGETCPNGCDDVTDDANR